MDAFKMNPTLLVIGIALLAAFVAIMVQIHRASVVRADASLDILYGSAARRAHSRRGIVGQLVAGRTVLVTPSLAPGLSRLGPWLRVSVHELYELPLPPGDDPRTTVPTGTVVLHRPEPGAELTGAVIVGDLPELRRVFPHAARLARVNEPDIRAALERTPVVIVPATMPNIAVAVAAAAARSSGSTVLTTIPNTVGELRRTGVPWGILASASSGGQR